MIGWTFWRSHWRGLYRFVSASFLFMQGGYISSLLGLLKAACSTCFMFLSQIKESWLRIKYNSVGDSTFIFTLMDDTLVQWLAQSPHTSWIWSLLCEVFMFSPGSLSSSVPKICTWGRLETHIVRGCVLMIVFQCGTALARRQLRQAPTRPWKESGCRRWMMDGWIYTYPTCIMKVLRFGAWIGFYLCGFFFFLICLFGCTPARPYS